MDEAAKAVLRALAGSEAEQQKSLDGFIRAHARHYEFASEHAVLIDAIWREKLGSE